MTATGAASRSSRIGSGASRGRYPQLHPGPGHSQQQVASHQRARICSATIDLVAERGYGAVTVSEVVQLAGVSKHTFYRHFKDKDECFLATYDLIALRAAKHVRQAQTGERDWRTRIALALDAWMQVMARHPRAARLALVEAFAGGPAALERMRRAEELFEAMMAQSFARAPDRVQVPRVVIRGLVAGVHRVASARLLENRAHELPDLAEEVLDWMLCLRCEAATAVGQLGCRVPAAPTVAVLDRAAREDPHDAGVGVDDRARILYAAMQLAAREGYWQLSVPRIRAAAGISRRRFDAHFAGVQDCFLAVVEQHTSRALAYARSVGVQRSTWVGRLHRAMHALCVYIAANPAFARLGFVEVFSPGLDGIRCRARTIEEVARRFRASAPAHQRPSALAAEASVGAVWGVIQRYVAGGLSHRLVGIAPTLSYLALAPAVGADRAIAAIGAEHRQMLGPSPPACAAYATTPA